MSLEWVRLHPLAIGSRSKCGNYSVCPFFRDPRRSDEPDSWEAWRLTPGGAWFAPLEMGLPTEEAARERCEQDAANKAAA
jgi:hypothetical protein